MYAGTGIKITAMLLANKKHIVRGKERRRKRYGSDRGRNTSMAVSRILNPNEEERSINGNLGKKPNRVNR